MIRWFEKAKKSEVTPPPPPAKDGAQQSAAPESVQGNYTDHQEDALKIRQQISPMHGEEKEAFEYCLKKLDEMFPDHSFKDTVQEGFSLGMFDIGKDGELRVSREAFA